MKNNNQQKTFRKKKCKGGKRPAKGTPATLLKNDRFSWNDNDIVIDTPISPQASSEQ